MEIPHYWEFVSDETHYYSLVDPFLLNKAIVSFTTANRLHRKDPELFHPA